MNATFAIHLFFDQTPRISPSPGNLTDDAPLLLVYSGLSLALCWYDLRYGLLPDRLTCPLLWSGLLYYLYYAPLRLEYAVGGAIGGYLAFTLLYWLYRGFAVMKG